MADNNIKGLTIEFNADTSKFKSQMNKFNKDLSETRKESKALSDSLKFEWNPDKFLKAQDTAKKAIEKTEEKAQVLRDRLRAMEEHGIRTDKQKAELQKWQTELAYTEKSLGYLQNELKKLNNVKMEHLQKQFTDLGEKISKAGQLMLPVSAAAGSIVAGLGTMGIKAVSTADDIATLAVQLGVSNEQLQRFEYIAMQTDVSNERMIKGFTKLRTAVGQSLMGASNMATKALDQLGFSVENLQGKSDEQIFQEVIAQLGQVSSSSEQAALMSQIFGERVATDLIPLVKTGAGTLAELNAEFEASGYLTDEQVDKLAEFDNVMNRIKQSIKNAAAQIGSAMLPVMELIAEFMETKVIPPLQKFTGWFSNLSDGTKTAIVAVGGIVAAIAPLLLIGGKLTSGVGKLLPLISKIGPAVQGALGPVGIILGILTLLYTTNENFRNSINDLIGTLMSSLAPILSTLGEVFNQLMAAIGPVVTLLGDALGQAIGVLMPILDSLLAILMPIVNIFIQKFVTQIKMLSNFIQILVAVLQPLIVILNDVLSAVLQTIVMPILSALMSMIGGITDLISPLISWVGDLTDKFKNLVVKALKPVSDALGFIWGLLKSILGIKDEDVDIKVNYKTDDLGVTNQIAQQEAMKGIITNNNQALSNTSNTTSNYTDNSTKNIEIHVTVENYAQEVDIDNMVEQINRKLAEQF
jgi:phage-related minor tail protein